MEGIRAQHGGGRWSGGNVTKMFTYLSTFAVLALSANFLARRQEGIDVTDALNAICEELARRYGVDLCRMRDLKILPEGVEPPPVDSFTALFLMIATLAAFAILRGGKRRALT